jgi:hypothetical protein
MHVYWLGGGSCAGKSTIARRIASHHRLHLYATDAVMAVHAQRLLPNEAPYLDQFKRMDMNERWVNRSPHVMLETFHWFRGEGFGLIVDDILRLASDSPVIAEGFRLLPRLVQPLLDHPDHAVWLLPTPEFRQFALRSRSTGWQIPLKTTDPARARKNLLERDRLFTQRLSNETRALGLRSIQIDIGMTEDDLACQVAQAFGL